MIRKTKSQKLIFSDGTSQQDRYQDALNPEYVQVEGRSIADLIGEAQRLAKELQFFDAQNNVTANWEALLIDNPEEYDKKRETGKEIQRRRWAETLADYVEHPGHFQNDPEKLNRLSRPHVVLFMAFLRLMNHVKSQINGLTKKHLDFYFLERLGFTPKAAVPDVVHVLLELAANVGQLELKKGTVLSAGNDGNGNALHYTTDRDTVISEAHIAQLKTVFVEKNTLTIRDAHLNNVDDVDSGFTRMMEMALGSPEPGDPLPALPDGVEDLVELNTLLEQVNAAAMAYITEQLCFSPQEDFKNFRLVLQTHLKDADANLLVEPQEWEEVYRLLDQAYKNRTKKKRQSELQELRESDAANGLNVMLQHVYGSPQAGDALPLYRGSQASIVQVHADLIGPETNSDTAEGDALKAAQQKAVAYLQEELRLSQKDFIKLVQVSQNTAASAQEWKEVYEILELANRKVRSTIFPSPIRQELFDVYAEADATANAFSLYGEAEESVRFKTFGGKQPGIDQLMNPANIGFAISSPIFHLQEGKRKITATVAFAQESGDAEQLTSLFNPAEDERAPFNIFLSSEEEWIPVSHSEFSFGDHIVGAAESGYSGEISGEEITRTKGEGFDRTDTGKYLAWTDGSIYEIIDVNSPDTVVVSKVGQADVSTRILKYSPEAICLNSLQIIIERQAEDLPVVPMGPDGQGGYLQSEFPCMAISLNHKLATQQGKESYRSDYQALMNLKMEKVHLKVDVRGMRDLTLQNDLSQIDGKKPFEPFGFSPEVGNSFYLTNRELCHKRLDEVELDLQWMKVPDDFKEYYANYWKVEADKSDLPASSYAIKGNADFKASVFLYDKRAELELGEHSLFTTDGKIKVAQIASSIKQTSPNFQYESNSGYKVKEDVLDCDRYFKLELDPRDFQHSIFSSLFRKQALSDSQEVRKLHLNTPYTPKLKNIKAGYSAHTEIVVGKNTGHDRLYHLHPFGFNALKTDAEAYLLPQYQQEGYLYLGIDSLALPQTLSILFQMSEGSADPDIEKPEVAWSYLSGNEWQQLGASAILSDTTNGLLNTGIVQLAIPADATADDTLLPGQLHWLRVTCDCNTTGISDTIQIVTQAISATFSSPEVAASHFVDLLPPESITETVEFSPGIRKISQPYTSSKGKPAEKDAAFYNRISERLRHKNRAINMWDYERMVLDQFPEVYKVKCLPATTEQNNRQLGTVNVLVIPDIKGKLPFNPFEPKVPADTLLQVQNFLDNHTPAYADVTVRNPTYVQIKIRCVVRFKPGYNEGFYKPKLIEDLKKFLAPWAYDEGGNITIGGSVYASVIVNFIAEQPYIDYVANMKLFQSEDGRRFTDVSALNEGQNKAIATRPDTVLVSAQTHEIDIVDEAGYDEDDFGGINYMKVELDFQVGENVLP